MLLTLSMEAGHRAYQGLVSGGFAVLQLRGGTRHVTVSPRFSLPGEIVKGKYRGSGAGSWRAKRGKSIEGAVQQSEGAMT